MQARPNPTELDAYGDEQPASRFAATTPAARRVAFAVFWSLAAVLIAGRVHFAPRLVAPAMELAAR